MIDNLDEIMHNSDSMSASNRKHHEDTISCRNRFVSDVKKLEQGFAVNPFEAFNFPAINNTSVSFSEEVVDGLKGIALLGE